ncbi:MAG: hypothetical protein ACKO38_08525 [Planctomycetota bacterium]
MAALKASDNFEQLTDSIFQEHCELPQRRKVTTTNRVKLRTGTLARAHRHALESDTRRDPAYRRCRERVGFERKSRESLRFAAKQGDKRVTNDGTANDSATLTIRMPFGRPTAASNRL